MGGGRRSRQALRALAERLGLKPRQAFQPIRLAVTGSKVSPGLFESLELLGRDESLARLTRAARRGRAGATMQTASSPPTQSGQGPKTAPMAKAATPATVSTEARSGARSSGICSGGRAVAARPR